MTKLKDFVKPNKQLKKVVKQNVKVNKRTTKVPYKRLLMLQRRLNSLISEKSSWEEKNRDLLNSLKSEKDSSAALRKELFHKQRLYHEAIMTINGYKVKQNEMLKTMSMCMGEIDSIYPHMVALSDKVTSNKIRLSNMLKSVDNSEYEYLPRQLQHIERCSESPRNGKPTKHKVGPMVKGLLITKPKIMLERVMLPQPQDQEPNRHAITNLEVDNGLTPIPEADEMEEAEGLRNVAVRPKRKLGANWRRRQEDKDRKREREKKPTISPPPVYDGDSSDSESNPRVMEPVLRYKDVSRLLQNSSLMKVNMSHYREGDAGGGSKNRKSRSEVHHLPPVNPVSRAEDPLEGSSWMFNNMTHSLPPPKKDHRSSYKSSSSDEDDDENNGGSLARQQHLTRPSNTLLTFSQNNQRSSSSPNTSGGSPVVEPDSTINTDEVLGQNRFSRSSPCVNSNDEPDSLVMTKSSTDVSNTFIEYSPKNNTLTNQRMSVQTNSLSVRLSKVTDTSKLSTSYSHSEQPTPDNSRPSFCNNCSPMPSPSGVLGKRQHKRKIIILPGEEDTRNPPKVNGKKEKKARLSIGKKFLPDKKTMTEKKKLKKRLSTEPSPNSDGIQNAASKVVKNKKKTASVPQLSQTGKTGKSLGKKSLQTPRTSSIGMVLQGSSDSSSSTKKKPKNTLVPKLSNIQKIKLSTDKKSIHTPRNSSLGENLQNSSVTVNAGDNGLRLRRQKSNVSYKESPLNVKMRRP